MGNTLSNMSPTVVQDEILPALKLGLIPLSAFSIDFTDEPLAVGDVHRVPIATARTGGALGASFEDGDTTVASTAITVAVPRSVSWYVDPKREAAPTMERFLAQGRECAYALAKDILQIPLALMVTANIGNTNAADKYTVTAANYDVDDIADQWGLLKTKKVAGNLSAIHNIAYATALLKDPALKDFSASQSAMLRTGELPPILGMRTFYTDAFPTALTNEHTGVVFTGSETIAGVVGAGHVPVDGLESAAGVREFSVTDPDTGLSMMYRQWVNTAKGAYWGAVYAFTGFAFLRNSATRILSA
jgi:hypothetical protein